MSPRLLITIYLAVVLAPLTLSWTGARPPRGFWDELASGAGMLAFAIVLAEFLLSGRFRSVSGRIGMDVTMRIHQLLARSALVLALVHPFLYRAPFKAAYVWDATRQFTLTHDFTALGTGVLAWLLLPALVLLAVGRDRFDYSYETWRLMHGLGALLISALMLHHTLYAGRYSEDPVVAAVWVGLFAIAVASLVHVYLLKPALQLRRPWRVKHLRRIGLKIWELTLAPAGHPGVRYAAGQFVWLNVGRSPFTLFENPFSISSAPASGDDLQFVIKELGDFTGALDEIRLDARAYVDGPHGALSLAGRTEPGVALIAGGVGVAPLLGMLRQLRLENDKRPTTLIYGNRVAEQIVYREELDALAQEHGTRVVHALYEPPEGWTGYSGMVDADLIRREFDAPETRRWLYVLCGPPEMMQAVEDALIAIGVPARQILSERFKYD